MRPITRTQTSGAAGNAQNFQQPKNMAKEKTKRTAKNTSRRPAWTGSASFAKRHPWWKAVNERRSELIGRKHSLAYIKPLTDGEKIELAQLQELAGLVRHWNTPPIPERLMPNAEPCEPARK